MKVVLDASAVLALMFGETGCETVAAVLDDAGMSTVNLSEVMARFARDGHDPSALLTQLQATGLNIVGFEAAHAVTAANLVPKTRQHGLSLGDRACLALAMVLGIPALTADRAWQKLDLNVQVQLIR